MKKQGFLLIILIMMCSGCAVVDLWLDWDDKPKVKTYQLIDNELVEVK